MAKTTQDVVGFRRIFILFCTLVLLPAMLLSGFGIVAIDNERSAVRHRQRERAEIDLRRAEERLVAFLRRTSEAVAAMAVTQLGPQRGEQLRATLAGLRAEGMPIGPALLLAARAPGRESSTLLSPQTPLAIPLAPLPPLAKGKPPPDLPIFSEPPFGKETGKEIGGALTRQARSLAKQAPIDHVTHAPVGEPGPRGLMAVRRTANGSVVAYLLDVERLAKKAARTLNDGTQIKLRLASDRPPREGSFDRWLETKTQPGPHARLDLAKGQRLITEQRLRPPFDRIVLFAIGPEPTDTTIVVYIVLLVLFYVLLIIGVVITSRLIWQEAHLSRLKTDFVSHVSHELRTPLTSIRMFIETLRLGRATSPEEQEECLELLSRETERLTDMIERVLGYARLRSGRRIFDLRPVAPEVIVEDALDAFRAHILGAEAATEPSQRLAIEVDLAADLPAVIADREAVAEALLNLISNAWKYSGRTGRALGEEKHIRVFVRASRRRVIIGVEDNGPGLPKEEHARIFDRFYQAGAGLLNRGTVGSGLGLAITKSIIEGNRGRISVESEEGRGCTFRVELRLAPAPVDKGMSVDRQIVQAATLSPGKSAALPPTKEAVGSGP